LGFTNLFQSTPFGAAMTAAPLACFDVGCRGGFEADLLPVAFATDAVGFEPDAEEFARLEAAAHGEGGENGEDGGNGPWRSLRYVPAALAAGQGRRELFVPTDPQSASLLRPDTSIGERFDKPQFFTVERTATVEAVGLDEAIARWDLPPPDYLKLDTEGTELEILESGAKCLAGVLAIKTEVSFMALRKGQPLARDIDRFLSGCGFELMDLVRPAHWRRHGYIIHPQMTPEPVPYARGQIVHGDYLYFRTPETLDHAVDDTVGGTVDDTTGQRQFKAAALAMAHGYFDHAESLLARPEAAGWLAQFGDVGHPDALGRCAQRYGRLVWFKALFAHLRGFSPFLRHARFALPRH